MIRLGCARGSRAADHHRAASDQGGPRSALGRVSIADRRRDGMSRTRIYAGYARMMNFDDGVLNDGPDYVGDYLRFEPAAGMFYAGIGLEFSP